MLDPKTLRTAIVLCLRAPLKGEEARDTVAALDALQEVYDATQNVGIAGALTLSSTQPVLDFNETDGPIDEKFWRWTASIGDLYLQTKTDALGVGANVLRITRTGTTVDLIRAVATSVDVVGALTATSYGGITEANLLDKTALETFSGTLTVDNNIIFEDGKGLTHSPGGQIRMMRLDLADEATGTVTVGFRSLVFVSSTFNADANLAAFMAGQQSPNFLNTLGVFASHGDSVNPDVDGDANYWKSSDTVLSIKNRLGSTRQFFVVVFEAG